MGEIELGRRPRVEYYGAIYHIIQRGNNKNYIFNKTHEKIELLNIIGEAKELFDFYLLAYCIMDNHYHLVIKTHNIPISKIMHRINGLYAKYYNHVNKRTGSPFEGRYKSIIVDNEYYLFNLINYIHNNPVYKNMVDSMTEYKWSSDVFFRLNMEGIVDIDYTLDILSQNRDMAINNYIELMSVYNDDYEVLKQEFEGMTPIGGGEQNKELKETKHGLDQILKDICKNINDYELIKAGSRKSYLISYKVKFVEVCIQLGFSLKDIGNFMSISERSIRRYLEP